VKGHTARCAGWLGRPSIRASVRAGAAVLILAAAGCAAQNASGPAGHNASPGPRPQITPRRAAGELVTTPGHYLGVAEAGEVGSYQQVSEFAATIGRKPNLVLYYSALGTPFDVRLASEALAQGATTFVQINPGSIPLSAVAAGQEDQVLRAYAASVRAFGHPVVIGFAPEMNAGWYSWGWHHTSPATWIAAWRHVVTVFRQQGATNVTWLWTINADEPGSTGPLQDWWPGAAYVDWVGIDGYYYERSSTFASVFSPTISQVRALTRKPILVSETAIGQVAGQAAKVAGLIDGVKAAGLLGFVWFDEAQNGGLYHQDWRLEGHPAAIAAFRRALAGYPAS